MILCDDALKYLAMCPDRYFAGVVADPPESISGDVIHELLRVSRGPVLVLAPLVWMGEPFPRSMRLSVQPEAVLRWWTTRGEAIAWGPIYAWGVEGKEWEERSYPSSEFSIDGFLGAKPEDLFARLCVLIGSGPILDPFAGSGPTERVCKAMNLDSVSIDNDPACCEYIERRGCGLVEV